MTGQANATPLASVVVAGEDRATQGTPLLGGVEFAIFVSSGGAFDHGKKDVWRLGS